MIERSAAQSGAGRAEGTRGMVVSTDGYASRVGIDVLADGGNAIDAAVAVSFGLAVVNPEAGNLGGGGFLIVRSPGGELAALDYRSSAPAAAHRGMFKGEGSDGHGEDSEPASVTGPLAAGVPGAVRGLWEAHRSFGRLPWARLVDPAVELARGFRVTPRLVASFAENVVAGLRRFPESAAIFLPRPGLRPPEAGDVFRQQDLVGTLERIRDRGADGFYRGETADRIVAEMERSEGLIAHADLAGYRAVWRSPLRFRYGDATVVSMPPSSSGGVTLAMTANILNRFPMGETSRLGADHVHLLAEAWRRSYADRNHYLADPDFEVMPLDVLTSPGYGAWRARDISSDRATPSAEIGPGVEAYLGAGEPQGEGVPHRDPSSTTHLSVVDAEGRAVSLTTTLNTWYGSKVVVPGTGVLLNNEMDDFTTRPGRPNFFGLVQGEANAIEPGKRMLSAMTPTVVLRGDRLALVVGTPGGATIISTVFQVVSNLIDFGLSLEEAVRAPRVHHQHLPDRIEIEPGALAPGVLRELRDRGHRIHERDERWGDVQAIRVGDEGELQGVSDPRRGGVALTL